MSRELFILRHAKSDWDSGASKDSERPLNKRGSKEAPKIGAWMHEQGLMPAQVYCSTAVRARETLQAVAKELRLPSTHIHFMDALYLADLRTLLKTLAEIPPQHTSAMLVGHNPGLDELVSYLSHKAVPFTASGKLMTTACLAHFRLPDDWHELARMGELLRIIRPADLD